MGGLPRHKKGVNMGNKNKDYFPEIPNQIDNSVQLSEGDEAFIEGMATAIINNIFRREKDPLKRRVLIDNIPRVVDSAVHRVAAHKEMNIKIRRATQKFREKS